MADFDTAQGEECLVDIGTAFESDAQAAVLVQPTVRAFDHPAGPTQTAAVCGVAAGQHRLNMSQDQLVTVRLRIVSPITL